MDVQPKGMAMGELVSWCLVFPEGKKNFWVKTGPKLA